MSIINKINNSKFKLDSLSLSVLTKTWMQDCLLPSTKLTNLYLPGTHNSATNACEDLASFSHNPINYLFVKPWAQCQDFNITKQLSMGVRALDIRIANFKNKTNDTPIYTSHTMRFLPFEKVLIDIKNFIQECPREIIILRIKKDWNQELDYIKAKNIIINTIGSFCLNFSSFDNHITIGDIWNLQQNIILITEEEFGLNHINFSPIFNAIWYNQSSTYKLIEILKQDLLKHSFNLTNQCELQECKTTIPSIDNNSSILWVGTEVTPTVNEIVKYYLTLGQGQPSLRKMHNNINKFLYEKFNTTILPILYDCPNHSNNGRFNFNIIGIDRITTELCIQIILCNKNIL